MSLSMFEMTTSFLGLCQLERTLFAEESLTSSGHWNKFQDVMSLSMFEMTTSFLGLCQLERTPLLKRA